MANFGNNWGFHLLLTELPIYMKTILRRDINSNALLSALPYACMWAFSLLVSYLADKAINKKILPTGIVRRIATAIGKHIYRDPPTYVISTTAGPTSLMQFFDCQLCCSLISRFFLLVVISPVPFRPVLTCPISR